MPKCSGCGDLVYVPAGLVFEEGDLCGKCMEAEIEGLTRKPTMNQLALIRDILKDPYWGRTVRECPECSGSKLRTTRYDVRSCSVCQGHGVVFREDTEGRELIAEAMGGSWHPSSSETRCFFSWWDESIFHAYDPDGESIWLQIWDSRQGQPWQSALDSYVRDYEPVLPDDYLTEHGGERLKGFLREAGYSYRTGWPHRTGLSYDPAADKHVASIRDFRRVGGSWYAEADTESAALLEAVRAAFPEEQK